MFDTTVAGMGAAATLAAYEANEAALIGHEVRRLTLAAHWADLHPKEAVAPQGLPGRERAVQPGGDGTPEVAQFCFADLGAAMQATSGTAARVIADGLDLRHRLPLTWAAARDGRRGRGAGRPGTVRPIGPHQRARAADHLGQGVRRRRGLG